MKPRFYTASVGSRRQSRRRLTIVLDLAKNVFQVHGVDAQGTAVARKALLRSQMRPFFEKLPPCLVGIEACDTSHYWARELTNGLPCNRHLTARYQAAFRRRRWR